MKMNWKQITFLSAAVAVGLSVFAATADAADWGQYQVDDRRSGFTYMTDESRAMQVDNFQNPGMLWLNRAPNSGARLTARPANPAPVVTVILVKP